MCLCRILASSCRLAHGSAHSVMIIDRCPAHIHPLKYDHHYHIQSGAYERFRSTAVAAVKGPSRQATPLIRCVAAPYRVLSVHTVLLSFMVVLVISLIFFVEHRVLEKHIFRYLFLCVCVCGQMVACMFSLRNFPTIESCAVVCWCFYFQITSMAGALHGVSFVAGLSVPSVHVRLLCTIISDYNQFPNRQRTRRNPGLLYGSPNNFAL